jgi:hypothetical protein
MHIRTHALAYTHAPLKTPHTNTQTHTQIRCINTDAHQEGFMATTDQLYASELYQMR